MRRNWCRAAVGGLVLAMASSTAFAQGAPPKAPPPQKAPAGAPKAAPKPKLTKKQREEEAAKLFSDGKTKFTAGDFQGAYEAFKAADELIPDPPVPKFRMAEALDKAGDVDGAIKAYENFLAAKPRPVEDKDRIETATARIAALKNAPAEVKLVLSPAEAVTAVISLDGAPASNPVKVPPGKHTITAVADGFVEGKIEVEVQRGEKKEVTLTLTPKPVVAPPPVEPPPEKPVTPEKPKPAPAPTSTSSVIPAIVTLSLAGAGVVVGAVFGGLALKSKGEFDDNPTQDNFDATERNALIADMSFGVALTFGVTGVVLLLTDSGGSSEPADKDKKAAKVNGFFLPYATPEGAGAVGRLTF